MWGESVTIPSRTYHDEPNADVVRSLSGIQQVILRCRYSRHCDGSVRQCHLEQIVRLDEAWVVPSVVQLAGEYVVETLEAIYRGLAGFGVPDSVQRGLRGESIARNPDVLRPYRTACGELLVLLLSPGMPRVRHVSGRLAGESVSGCHLGAGRRTMAPPHTRPAERPHLTTPGAQP